MVAYKVYDMARMYKVCDKINKIQNTTPEGLTTHVGLLLYSVAMICHKI